MLERIITLSVKNKFLILLFTIGLFAVGIYSMLNLSIDAVPDITNNQVQIVTSSPSLAAKEVEQFITYPVEMQMANVQDVIEIRSISRYGLSVVTVVFDDKVEILDARQLVGQQLQVARQEIPEGYGEPSLMPITTGLGEIYQYTLDVKPGYEKIYTATALRTIHDWVVKRQLNGIPGIVEISSFGGYLKEYEVSVNPNTLASLDLDLIDVNQALQSNNQNTGGSYIQNGPYAYYIRTNGLIENISDIENIVITVRKGIPVSIKDIAEVRIGHPPRFGAMTKDGKGEAVGGITLMLKGGNASKVIAEVKERVKQIENNLPEGIEINPYLDRSILVKKVIHTVSKNLIEGGLIVVFILVLLLGNFRAGLIVASVIPLSMLFAFTMMHLFGITATVMSLGAIDFGLIVDATVIVIESIIYQIEKQKQKLNNAEMDKLVLSTTLKIRSSAAFGAIIILIVYLPILSLSGIEGKMFRPMALTVSFAIIGALILSFTYIPAISALFLSREIKHNESIASRLMNILQKSYKPVFNFSLQHKKLVLMIAFAIFISSLIIFKQLGAEFLPDLDEGDLAMQMTIPPGSSLNESIKTSTKAEQVLLENFPEVKTIVSKIGTAEVPTDPMAIEDADIMIILEPKKEWSSAKSREELVDKMKEKLEVVLGASFEFTQPIQLRFNELLTGAKADVVVKIYGEDLEVLYEKAVEASKIIEKVQGAADVKVEQIEGLPQLVVDYNRSEMAKYGVNIEDVNTVLRTALAGEKAGVIFEGERKFDLVVRLEPEYRNNVNEFETLRIKSPKGIQIPLSQLATIGFVESPMQISRDNAHRRISIGINVRNRDVQSVVEDIQQGLNSGFKLPPGYYVTYGGKFENLQSALARGRIVVPIALLLIFLLLYFAFGTFRQAILIFLTIPLSIIGGIFALWIRGLPFSISAGIGFIALFGVAVLDGIVLINHLNELKEKGVDDLHERLRQGTRDRLRPVAITSAVASLGFMPMALATSAGAEVQRPLATVVIGGIITSTFLTMIVLPLVYYYFQKGLKTNNLTKTGLSILLMFLLPLFVNAATLDSIPAITREKAVALAIENSFELKNLELDQQNYNFEKKALQPFGETELSYQHGNINSDLIDYNLAITQNLVNPFFILNKRKELEQLMLSSKAANTYKIRQIENNVNQLFYSLYFKKQLIEQYSSILKELKAAYSIAKTKYNLGDEDLISSLLTEEKLNNYTFERSKHATEYNSLLYTFNFLLNADTIYKPDYRNIKPSELVDTMFNCYLPDNSQLTLVSNYLKSAKQAEVATERSKYLPDIYVGYFNQQIDEQPGFVGWEAGISVPLWFFGIKNNVSTAKVNADIAENLYQQELKQRQVSLNNMILQLKTINKSINYYEQTGLKNAGAILQKSNILLKNGEISHSEYLRTTEEAFRIKINYYQTLIERQNLIFQIKNIVE